jgi:hypothetical protein
VPIASPVHVLALALWLVLPGLAWSLWWTAGCALSPLSTVALAVPAGIVLMASSGFVLALGGVLTPVTVAVAWTAIVAVGWFGAIRRGDVRARWRSARQQIRDAPIVTSVGVLLLLAFGVVRASYGQDRNLVATALRYWADGVEVADAGGFPKSVLHWGIEVQPTMSKVLMNVLYAQERFILGREALPALAASLFVVSISLALIFTAFLLEAGIRRMALAVVAVVVGATLVPGLTFAADLRGLVAEDWGRTLAFAAMVPAVVALRTDDRRRARRLAILAGVLLGTTAGIHLVAALAGAVMVAGLGAGWALAGARWRSALAGVLTVAAVAIAVEGAVLVAAPGDLGFQGAAGDRGYDSVRQELGEPESFDPVLFLTTEGHPQRIDAVPRDPLPVLETLGAKLVNRDRQMEGDAGPVPLLLLGALFLVSLVVVLVVSHGPDLRALGIASAFALLAFAAIAVGFAVRFDTFALSNFGVRRLSQYIGPAGLVLFAAAAEALVDRLPTRASVAVGVTITVLAASAILPFAWAEPRGTARSDLAAFAWIADHVPCEGRVLVDRRTLASVETLAGRAGVLEGMGPHLRPSLLVRAIEEMEQAKRFFLQPAAGADYLRSHGVAAVMVADSKGDRFGGWSKLANDDPTRMAEAPFLHAAYHDDGITIYSVDGWTVNAELPSVSGRPGYTC